MEKEVQFKEKLESLRLNWWHWIPGAWLIIDEIGVISSRDLRNIALNNLGNSDVLVIEVTGNINWAGYGPTGSEDKENMFRWIEENWAKSDYQRLPTTYPKA